MHFARSLSRAVYAPWKDQYIDYAKLKQLLHDQGSDAGGQVVAAQEDDDAWTEEDETKFVGELINVQLEKVHKFHRETIEKLRERTAGCEAKLDDIAVADKKQKSVAANGEADEAVVDGEQRAFSDEEKQKMKDVLQQLDGITKEMNELEKYSRINYTGFLKAAKKHDRKRGHSYRVRPILTVRLQELPFNKEDYSPLLFRLQTMYSFIRTRLQLDKTRKESIISLAEPSNDRFVSHKLWVHPENLLELRTIILRRLPVLVYNPQSSKIASGMQPDPTLTSIYFDNSRFSLYNEKIESHAEEARSLRMRWNDSLNETAEIYVEKKTVYADDTSKEQRLTIKPKYVQAFLDGEYKLEKDVAKLSDRFGEDSTQVKTLKDNVADIQDFIKSQSLQPVVRANYSRTAFEIPGDNRVRITLDTNLALIREDALDPERPCRDPETWHRKDIDDTRIEFPFENIRKGEIDRFPYALLEIRIKGNKQYEWINELMSSHLVKPAPRFSKFAHGVAQLFEDYVNTFPFWLGEVDTDIRRDPQQAFDEEQDRLAKVAEDESLVGSFLAPSRVSGFSRRITSPVGSASPKSSALKAQKPKATAEQTRASAEQAAGKSGSRSARIDIEDSDDDDYPEYDHHEASGLRAYFPSFTRHASSQRHGQVKLPPGVNEPTYWIKNEGENKVEAKVWLANQRTYIKWQHVGILLASLSLGLYNSAGKHNLVAQAVAVVYTLIGLFTIAWGYIIYIKRSRMIQERSGKDFDSILGPIVVCVGLIVALSLNAGFKIQALLRQREQGLQPNESISWDLDL